jgi:acyl phosphate:glycerol-3-phosphate acyltransferase
LRHLASGLIGYGLGILPTASLLGSAVGIDLRRQGSGNPGANNAMRLGGVRLGAAVLLVEMSKGASAAFLGGVIAGGSGMVAGGLAAAAGNMYNAVYRFGGGKGLGISAGVVAVTWPVALLPIVGLMALAIRTTHSSDAATLVTMTAVIFASVGWALGGGLPNLWGLSDPDLVLLLGCGLAVLIVPRHTRNIRFRRPPSPA